MKFWKAVKSDPPHVMRYGAQKVDQRGVPEKIRIKNRSNDYLGIVKKFQQDS